MAVRTEPAAIPGAFSGTDKRADFPVFERPTGSGNRLVYLDSAASAPKPRVVIDAMQDAYSHHYANVHRGIYELSEDATQRFESARRKVTGFLNAPSEREIVFVRNATEAINLVAYSWGRTNLGAGDVMVTTQLEHHANIVPWQQLTREVGAELRYVLITDDGQLDLDDLDRHLAAKPKLVAVAAVSQRAGHHQPAFARSPSAPMLPAPWSWSTRRRPPRTCPSTSRPSAATSWPSAATRCSAPRASAPCGAAASCWRPCRHS